MNKKYEVGYGKPPKKNRFKPGESGNRKGRTKGSKNFYTILNEFLNKKITLKENGRTIKISKKAALVLQYVNKGLKGDEKAFALLLPHIIAGDIKDEQKSEILKALNTEDQFILNTYLSNLAKFETREADGEACDYET